MDWGEVSLFYFFMSVCICKKESKIHGCNVKEEEEEGGNALISQNTRLLGSVATIGLAVTGKTMGKSLWFSVIQ